MSDTNDTSAAQAAVNEPVNENISETSAPAEVAAESTQATAPTSTGTVVVSIPATDHTEAQGIFAGLVEKLENFEHALAADARADIEKIKALLHL